MFRAKIKHSRVPQCAFYHKLGKTLNSPSMEANAKVQIIRIFIGCIGVRDKGKEDLSFWHEELNS